MDASKIVSTLSEDCETTEENILNSGNEDVNLTIEDPVTCSSNSDGPSAAKKSKLLISPDATTDNSSNDSLSEQITQPISSHCPNQSNDADASNINNFIEIDELAQAEVNSTVNVIGVVRAKGELGTFCDEYQGVNKYMRKFHLVDRQSNTNGIELLFWEDDAKSFKCQEKAVLALKGADLLLDKGNRKYLSVGQGTGIIKINQKITESCRPTEWLPIKARVTRKSNILNPWNNGKGQVFGFELANEDGEFRCTELADTVRRYYNSIEVDKVYRISNCQLKPVNEHYRSLKNYYEMTITPKTIIEECQDADAFNIFNFVEIDKLFTKTEVGSIVNVMGVVMAMDELGTFCDKNQDMKYMRKIYLVDQSTTDIIELVLWEKNAEIFQCPDKAVLAVKRANLSLHVHRNKKYLSAAYAASIEINPEIAECRRLKEWYDKEIFVKGSA